MKWRVLYMIHTWCVKWAYFSQILISSSLKHKERDLVLYKHCIIIIVITDISILNLEIVINILLICCWFFTFQIFLPFAYFHDHHSTLIWFCIPVLEPLIGRLSFLGEMSLSVQKTWKIWTLYVKNLDLKHTIISDNVTN